MPATVPASRVLAILFMVFACETETEPEFNPLAGMWKVTEYLLNDIPRDTNLYYFVFAYEIEFKSDGVGVAYFPKTDAYLSFT